MTGRPPRDLRAEAHHAFARRLHREGCQVPDLLATELLAILDGHHIGLTDTTAPADPNADWHPPTHQPHHRTQRRIPRRTRSTERPAAMTALDFTVQPEPPSPAPHRVKVRTVRVLGPERGSDWHDEVDYDIEHTPQCDALPYGQPCWLDQHHNDVGLHDWPTEPGEYTAALETWTSFEGEHDARIDFEPVAADATPQDGQR